MKFVGIILAAFAFAFASHSALAQQQQPNSIIAIVTGSSTNCAGTIASTGTFQLALAAKQNRKSCTIQNLGSNNMNVGLRSGATANTSFVLQPNQTFSCGAYGVTVNDPIYIAGTAADKFQCEAQ